MKFDPRWNLQWITPMALPASDFTLRVTQKCMAYAKDLDGKIQGFTIFESRDFGPDFIKRMASRLQKAEAAQQSWHLVLPAYLKSKWESLKSEAPALDVKFSGFIEVRAIARTLSIRTQLRVINIDDSPVLLKILKQIFDDFGYFDVVTQISDSTTAATKVADLQPDIVTLDIQMPNLNGVEVVKQILAKTDIPVIMVSSLTPEAGSLVFDALHAGAFDYIQKPRLEDREEFEKLLHDKALAAVEGRRVPSRLNSAPPAKYSQSNIGHLSSSLLWAFGASTGGTQALTQVFTSLPTHIPPTVVVQHIPPVFSKSFADSVNQLVPFRVKEAENNEQLLEDHIYIAPGGLQMGIEELNGKLFVRLHDSDPVNRFKPSVDFLFKQIAEKIRSRHVIASLLTGMGRDGAEGLLALRKRGAQTIAQNEESCAVFGMPRAAIELQAAEVVLALEDIAQRYLLMSQNGRKTA